MCVRWSKRGRRERERQRERERDGGKALHPTGRHYLLRRSFLSHECVCGAANPSVLSRCRYCCCCGGRDGTPKRAGPAMGQAPTKLSPCEYTCKMKMVYRCSRLRRSATEGGILENRGSSLFNGDGVPDSVTVRRSYPNRSRCFLWMPFALSHGDTTGLCICLPPFRQRLDPSPRTSEKPSRSCKRYVSVPCVTQDNTPPWTDFQTSVTRLLGNECGSKAERHISGSLSTRSSLCRPFRDLHSSCCGALEL